MCLGMSAGCTHFIIGRDMAGCKSSLTGEDFYGPYDAQDTAKANAKELGVEPVPSLNITYTEVCCCHFTLSSLPKSGEACLAGGHCCTHLSVCACL